MLELGMYTIKELDGVFMSETVSGNWLKLFHTREPIETLREDGLSDDSENVLEEDVYISDNHN